LWREGGAWCPTPSIPARHWIGKIGGGNTEFAQKNGFGVIPYFLEITDVGEAYLIFAKKLLNITFKSFSMSDL